MSMHIKDVINSNHLDPHKLKFFNFRAVSRFALNEPNSDSNDDVFQIKVQ